MAAMEDPLSWSLMMKDGTSYEFKADSADSRQVRPRPLPWLHWLHWPLPTFDWPSHAD